MRTLLMVVSLLLAAPIPAVAQVSIVFGLPSVRISFVQESYPRLVEVPGYPVYYDPDAASNYFFYDGLYWVYEGDTWYASSWYNGPWGEVAPEGVPLFILRVPVRYYRQPPVYFRGWRDDAPPRWGDHWGRGWERQRSGWERWDRRTAPAAAPLPAYQAQYSGQRYPHPEQQQALRAQHDRHEPRDRAVRNVFQAQRAAPPPAPPQDAQRPDPRATRREDAAPAQRAPERAQPAAPAQRAPERAQPVAPAPPRDQPMTPAHVQPVAPPRDAQRPDPRGNRREDAAPAPRQPERAQPTAQAPPRAQPAPPAQPAQPPRHAAERAPQERPQASDQERGAPGQRGGPPQQPRERRGKGEGQDREQGKDQGHDR